MFKTTPGEELLKTGFVFYEHEIQAHLKAHVNIAQQKQYNWGKQRHDISFYCHNEWL